MHPLRRGRPRRAVARVALEEQRLAGNRRHHRRLERFRDQERRLRPLAGEEALGIGGDEHYRHLETAQQLVDGIEARGAVGELMSARIRPGLRFLASATASVW